MPAHIPLFQHACDHPFVGMALPSWATVAEATMERDFLLTMGMMEASYGLRHRGPYAIYMKKIDQNQLVRSKMKKLGILVRPS